MSIRRLSVALGASVLAVVHCVGDDSGVPIEAGIDATKNDDAAIDQFVAPETGPQKDATTDVVDNDVPLAPLATKVSISMGYGFSCSLRASGKVFCWGQGPTGQLGNGLSNSTLYPTPQQVSVITNGARLASGISSTCAVLTDHTVSCWGSNLVGQLGQPLTTATSATPIAIAGLSNVMDIQGGGSHYCALKSDSTVWCWGANGNDQLGHANTTDPACGASTPCSVTPTKVTGLPSSVDEIASGFLHSCAHQGTQAWCWGDNGSAQLGHVPGSNGDITASTDYYNPTPVAAVATGVGLVFAGGNVTCSINGSLAVQCWGTDVAGQLGDKGVAGMASATPITVAGVSSATFVSPGWASSCAVANGGVYCWGDNNSSESGIGVCNTTIQGAALATGLNSGMVSVGNVEPAATHCAVDTGDAVHCWGGNMYDECGHSNASDPKCSGTPTVLTASAVTGLP